ncbi:MAG: hypothetical protein LBU74_03310 [Methanobacteriaceae archaeon]|jgi:hypothetical protein|nr:hypothetical protein [Candidatus Methanorudis spinitermitis]
MKLLEYIGKNPCKLRFRIFATVTVVLGLIASFASQLGMSTGIIGFATTITGIFTAFDW